MPKSHTEERAAAIANELKSSACTSRCSVLRALTRAAQGCVDFLAEIGHAFNRDRPPPTDDRLIARYYEILDDALGAW